MQLPDPAVRAHVSPTTAEGLTHSAPNYNGVFLWAM